MGSVSTIYNGVRTWLAGRALMDVALSDRSTNGVQNKVIKAKFDEVDEDITQLNSDLKKHHITTINNQSYSDVFGALYSELAALSNDKLDSVELCYFDGSARRHFSLNTISVGAFKFSNTIGGPTNIQSFDVQINNGNATFTGTVLSPDNINMSDYSNTLFSGYVDLIY